MTGGDAGDIALDDIQLINCSPGEKREDRRRDERLR